MLLLFSSLVVSNSLWSHVLQHSRHPFPSPSPRVCPSSFSLPCWCRPAISSPDALFFCPQSFPASGLFQWVICSYLMTKCWSFSFSISPSSKHSGLISLKIDWFDLLTAQGTFRSLLQHHSLKASILWHSAFIMVQFSQPYMITGKTIWTFAGRVMSLIFNTLSRFVIAFQPKKQLSSDFTYMILWVFFLIFSLKLALSLSSFTLIKRLFSSSLLSAIKSGIMCISEVADTSPGNLDSSLCFFQSSVSHDVLPLLHGK